MSPLDRQARLDNLRTIGRRLDNTYYDTQARLDNEKLRAEQEYYASRDQIDSEIVDLVNEIEAEEGDDA